MRRSRRRASSVWSPSAATGYADRHNISQGLYDPVAAAANPADPYAGNVPYTIAGLPVADRYSFYFPSECFIRAPDGARARYVSEDMRARGCRPAEGAGTTGPAEGDAPGRGSPEGGSEKEDEDPRGRQPGDGSDERPDDRPVEREASGAEGSSTSGTLPFTGFQLALLALTGAGLAAGGWATAVLVRSADLNASRETGEGSGAAMTFLYRGIDYLRAQNIGVLIAYAISDSTPATW